MWIIFILVAIIVILAVYGAISKKRGQGKSSKQLERIKANHEISLSFTSQGRMIAFCDTEQKIYNYSNLLAQMYEIPYSNILKCEKSIHINGVSFWALNPTYTEYISGDIGSDNVTKLLQRINDIIYDNKRQAEKDYAMIASIPSNAAQVTIKQYSGCSASIPNSIREIKSAFAWEKDGIFCLLSTFNLLDYKLHPQNYRLINIKKDTIVSVSQEGNVHYTTEVHGGGGGGSSIKGAVVGGIIAGEAGAIIGSRKASNPITSSTKQIDDRTTKLKILDTNNNFCEIAFAYNDYYAISKIIGK